MSEPKLISPLLDNHIIGDAISDRNGVRSCPAITKDNGDRYIVKIISIPASRSKLDALLLSGAYADEGAALAYFKELSEEVIEEANVLQKLSHLEGFISYDAWQTVQMDDETGYDVYLLRPYRRTLERQIRRNTMTHLAAVNLGIDICSALTVCQRSGYLYVDLKPSNIFLNEDKQYLIGDLGFIRLDSLKYASLPDKYRSAYTAPEVTDAYSSVNTTMGIYAAGLILYQVFNGGTLPFDGDCAPARVFDPPMYADYEMAEIIAKACAPDPADRWQTAAEMGRALVSYMQRNTVNETPIIPVVENIEAPTPQVDENASSIAEEVCVEDLQNPTEEDIRLNTADALPEIAEANEDEAAVSENIYTEDDCGNLSFLDDMQSDDSAPGEEDEAVDYSEISEEVSDILEQADDLIAHETPDPVIAPEPIDIPIPPLVVPDDEEEAIEEESLDIKEEDLADPFEADSDEEEEPHEEAETDDIADETSDVEDAKPVKKGKGKIVLRVIIIMLIAAGLLVGGFFLYQNFYLQRINNITLDGSNDSLSVILDTDIDNNLLSVVCSDIYGNQLRAPVVDGVATFKELSSDKTYDIRVVIDGFHYLSGVTSITYQTPEVTKIHDLSAVTGAQDGSVILLFGLEGPDSENWKVTYSTPGEEEKILTFSGHSINISDLTIGSEYTFKVEPETALYIDGETQISFTTQTVVMAEDLYITECADGRLSATWSCPEGVLVNKCKWIVRYICNDGSEATISTEETSATFEGIDHTLGYTVEVTAEGMSVSTRTNIMAGSITVSDLTVKPTNNDLHLTWDSSIAIGEEGWLLQYTIDGAETKYTLTCEENEATISPMIPGAAYAFTLSAADGNQVLNGVLDYSVAEAKTFNDFGATAERMTFRMCKTPSFSGWDRHDLDEDDFTTTFGLDGKASFLVRLRGVYDISWEEVEILYVIRTDEGEYVSCAVDTTTWEDLFNRGYCELDIPSIPGTAGDYSVTVYFNGAYAAQQDFTVTA